MATQGQRDLIQRKNNKTDDSNDMRTTPDLFKSNQDSFKDLTAMPVKQDFFFFFYHVFGYSDIPRSSPLHDSQRSAQITPAPVEGHSFKDGVYAPQHLHFPCTGMEEEESK